ncbi:relaxase/mobilization nuclease domain-containing protein [Pedobacter sp. AW1-32]|uniref:relaxase/mobilization nuclease domain-containing protein n=1 Tax=Pedobacter sp. AW1-32 TaxID=3383026 RepID=UPI003FEDD65B
MIGKVVVGKSFGGCVRYVVNKKDARLLYGDGIRLADSSLIIKDFNLQRQMNPGLSKAVGHISLSWSEEDVGKLNDENMLAMAKEYLGLTGIKNTQILIVRHHDNHHPHLHIIYSRVDNEGKAISDQFQFKRNVAACKSITLKHGLFIAGNRNLVNRKALQGSDKIKYSLFDTIKVAQKSSKDWQDFVLRLSNSGIDVIFKYKANSSEIQGISFKSGDYTFKGSQIDRSLSFGKLADHFLSKSKNVETSKSRENQPSYSPGRNSSPKPMGLLKAVNILFAPSSFPVSANEPEADPRGKGKKGIYDGEEDEEQSQGRGR